jgi:UDP-N-acetylglucosamine--N-acetylmuramyl-(pentapeptide) pyrophosphoryl-undecaprenol N-acetylglucosamine transferase
MAVREVLCDRHPDARVLFVGAAHGVEAGVLSRRGYDFRGLASAPVSGRGIRGRLTAALGLPGTVREALAILREFRPSAVLGMGGYASVPTMVAAALRRVPRVIHEQNAVPGLANRWLGRLAHQVAVSFAKSAPFFPAGRVAVTGNPVRAEMRPGDAGAARDRLGLAREPFTLLVVGGSQGAHRLNEAMRAALPELATDGADLQCVHATGAKDLDPVRRAYDATALRARVEPFIEQMAAAYQAADFVICRAGAGTVFELAAVGKPALLVPYPHAANDHQRLNAEAAVAAGAAWILADQSCDGRRLAASIRMARQQPAHLAEMGRKARTLARLDAADRVADLVEQVARDR